MHAIIVIEQMYTTYHTAVQHVNAMVVYPTLVVPHKRLKQICTHRRYKVSQTVHTHSAS